MFLLCVRDEWRQGQTAILTQLLLLTIAELLPHLGRCCSTRVAEGCSHQSSSWPSLWPSCDQLTQQRPALTCILSYAHLLPSRLPLIYTGASLHWRLGQGSIYIFILLIVMPDRRGSLHHNYLWLLLWPYSCHNILPADPHDLNFLNHSWPSDRQVVSLMSSQGYFTFPYGHTKHNIHNRESGRKEKKKQTWTWVSSKRKKGEICDTFEQLFVDQQAISSVYSSEIPTKSPGMQALTALSSRLPCFVHFSVLPSYLDCPLPTIFVDCPVLSTVFSILFWDLPSLVFFRSYGRSRAQDIGVGFAPKLKKGSSDWHSHTHPHNKCPTSCHIAKLDILKHKFQN